MKHDLNELSELYCALPRAYLDAVIAAQLSTADADEGTAGLAARKAAEAEIDAITWRIEAILRE